MVRKKPRSISIFLARSVQRMDGAHSSRSLSTPSPRNPKPAAKNGALLLSNTRDYSAELFFFNRDMRARHEDGGEGISGGAYYRQQPPPFT